MINSNVIKMTERLEAAGIEYTASMDTITIPSTATREWEFSAVPVPDSVIDRVFDVIMSDAR